jgi:hypothetical protein
MILQCSVAVHAVLDDPVTPKHVEFTRNHRLSADYYTGVRVRVPVGSRIFSSPRCPDAALELTQPIQWVPAVFPRE